MGKETAPKWLVERLERSPVRRERRRHFRSLTDFQRKLEIAYSVAYFTECGCYTPIPPVIVKGFRDRGVDVDSLCHEYREFQLKEQRNFGDVYRNRLLGDDFALVLDKVSSSVSFVELMMEELGLSQSELAKRLCVQISSLYRLRKRTLTEFPTELSDALYHAGIPYDVIRGWNCREEQR